MDIDNIMKSVSFNSKLIKQSFYWISAKDKEEIEKFVEEIQEISKVTWSIEKTIEKDKARNNLFKRIYYCHFNTRRRKSTTDLNKKRSRNIDCPAKLIITLKKVIPTSKSKANNSFNKVDKKYPCLLEFRNNHNHRSDVGEALRARPLGDEAKKAILNLFERGHSVASAYHTYCTTKMEELGDEYYDKIGDRHYFPSKTDVRTLWTRNFRQQYGERSGPEMLKKLEDVLISENERNGTLFKISTFGENHSISISTPIMQRAIKLPQASEMIFVDATGNCDVQDHKVYFFVTQSPVGGLPIGCIISSSQKKDIFQEAVQALLDILPVKIQPSVIMTDDDLGERNVLQNCFPQSKMLLCTFHVLKACWRWLTTAKNNIPKTHNQVYYQLFRKIVYSDSEDKLFEAKKILGEQCQHSNFLKYVENMYLRIETWCSFCRRNLILRGSDTNNYAEVMFRLLKDIPLERTKAFNLTQLADFICTGFERYYQQRTLGIVLNRESKAVELRYLPKELAENANIKYIGNLQYEVVSFSDPNITYQIDMITCMCSCPVGYNGKHCKHQAAVIAKFGILKVINTLTDENKILFYQISTGKEPKKTLFYPLQSHETLDTCHTSNLISPTEVDASITGPNTEPKVPEEFNAIEDLDSEIEATKTAWLAYSNAILKHIDNDPEQFLPAVNRHLDNFKKYATSVPSLLSGLHTAYKYKGALKIQSGKAVNPKISRKGVKISVQPTAVARRKSKISGKRKLAGRPSLNSKKSCVTAPHSLSVCVKNNRGLGSNKSKK